MSLRLVLTWLLAALSRGPAVHVHVRGHHGGPPQPNSTAPSSKAAAPGGGAGRGAPLQLAGQASDDGGCSACDFTVDFRCLNTFNVGPFHRIKDCLIPSYALVESARNATGRRCAIVKVGEASMEPLLSALATDVNFTFIRDGSPCLKKTSVTFFSLGHFEVGYFRPYTPSGPSCLHVSGWVPFNLEKNLGLLHHDAAMLSAGTPPGNGVLIIVRQETRSFTEKSLRMLQYTAAHSAGKPKVSLYFGNETQLDTIRMFTAASTLIGYHGAGFANSVFRASQHCAIEYTAYVDFAGKRVWRTNDVLADFLPKLSWYTHPIPLKSMLHCNGVDTLQFKIQDKDRNEFLKRSKNVCINKEETAALKENLGLCARDNGHG